MRIIVCGGRFYNDEVRVAERLGAFHARHGIDLVIHGNAPGADRLASRWAAKNGIPSHAYVADWKRYGDAAGPIRNGTMLRDGRPDAVLSFPGFKGTADMIRQAREAGIPVYME